MASPVKCGSFIALFINHFFFETTWLRRKNTASMPNGPAFSVGSATQ